MGEARFDRRPGALPPRRCCPFSLVPEYNGGERKERYSGESYELQGAH